MTIIGIDLGLDGAIAFLIVDGQSHDDPQRNRMLEIHDMPTLEIVRGKRRKRELDLAALTRIIDERQLFQAAEVWMEKTGAMPGQGVTSMFSFGRSTGQVEGVLAALQMPVNYVHPRTWKKALGVPAGKDAARLRASQLLPAYAHLWPLKKHHGRADAALIALYGKRHQQAAAA